MLKPGTSIELMVARGLAVGCLAIPLLVGAPPPGGRASAAPDPPSWPAADLVASAHGLLLDFYDQQASAASPYYYLAPEWESDKWRGPKDPDTLLEYGIGPQGACHAADSPGAFAACTGYRLAATVGVPVTDRTSLFDAQRPFDGNAALVEAAAAYSLYHAFVREFDASVAQDYTPEQARDAVRYHESMIRAYEAHMRSLLVAMFRDSRTDPAFQFALTRGVGRLAIGYARTLQTMEELGLWAQPSDRRNALALLNGMNQRLWWEWVWTQDQGPRTAGFVDLGSESTQQAAAQTGPRWVGTDRFTIDGVAIPSLRPDLLDSGPYDGFWVDSDYALPGEWWCYARYGDHTPSLEHCLAMASLEAWGGLKSPFGQYYGPEGASAGCEDRAGNITTVSCGESNGGSIAVDWTEAFLGARLGMFIIQAVAATGDPDLPEGAIGPAEYMTVTSRLGYGVAGWHGGAGHQDDLEWTWAPEAPVVSIRTLSAGRHDLEPQSGRFSLGETDTSPASVERKGDTWLEDGQEYPGSVEAQAPGPSSVFGARVLSLALSDLTADGLAGSFYDAYHRNEPDEFDAWVWLLLGSFDRCPGVADPADGSCLAASAADWPQPPVIHREPLYTSPEDGSVNLYFRYLWRNRTVASGALISPSRLADGDPACRGGSGLPWQYVYNWNERSNAAYLVDEAGSGAYTELIEGDAGLMRLLAARYGEDAPTEDLTQEYETQRDGLIAPWYDKLHGEVLSILDIYRRSPPNGYSYVPEIENAACTGRNPYTPGDPTNLIMLPWQVGTGDTVAATVAHRAIGYAGIARWYWWFATDWLDIDDSAW